MPVPQIAIANAHLLMARAQARDRKADYGLVDTKPSP
jgi:hypothetical protein